MKTIRCQDGTMIANSLITLMEEADINKISFNKYLRYQVVLAKYIRETFNVALTPVPHECGLKDGFINNRGNGKYFSLVEKSNKKFIVVNDGITSNDLRLKYRAPLSLEMQQALADTKEELLSLVVKRPVVKNENSNNI